MHHTTLGTTDIKVSRICLGTMNFGCQVGEADAHTQMDYALSQGVNFFDTAELYAIPPSAETHGKTEEFIGTWFKKSGKRQDVVLASKVMGPNPSFSWIRSGKAALNKAHIQEALEGSLRRLQTDVIDLYQIHWPQRPTRCFGQRGFLPQSVSGHEIDVLHETLETLHDAIKAGKIRAIGISNETAWGAMQYLRLHEKYNLPRIHSIQNPYSLLDRTFESDLSEIALQEKLGLLAYSPLAAGALTGKYIGGGRPAGTRWSIDARRSRYDRPNGERAIIKYLEIANKHGLDAAQMALAFVNTRSFLTANIIGATTMQQLETNIASLDIKLNKEILQELNAVHEDIPNPCP